MKKFKYVTIILVFLINLFMINNFVFAEEYFEGTLDEKLELVKECKEIYEQELREEMKPWSYGREYKYNLGLLSGCMDVNENIYMYEGFSGIASYEETFDIKLRKCVSKAVEEYLLKYKGIDNEKENLLGYFVGTSFVYNKEQEYNEYDDIEAKVNIFLIPKSNDSIWYKNAYKSRIKLFNKNINRFVEIDGFSKEMYIRLVWENDKYITKYFDTVPEGYNDYVSRMKNEHGIDVENIDYSKLINIEEPIVEITKAEEKKFESKQIAVSNIDRILKISFSVIIFIILCINIKTVLNFRKSERKK